MSEQHALAVLQHNDLWNPNAKLIEASGKLGGKLLVAAPKLLPPLIMESQRLGGEVLDHFWDRLGSCNHRLKENIERLKEEDFVSAQRSFEVLFRGLDPRNVSFEPVLAMASEFSMHLGVAFMSTAGRKSGTSTESSAGEVINEETDELLQRLGEDAHSGRREEEIWKALSFKRDGNFCLLTGTQFTPFDEAGIDPGLLHIVPNSVLAKPDTLRCIAIFAGAAAREDIVGHLNSIGNVMNVELDARTSYDKLRWGIEAKEGGGEVKYFFRLIPSPTRNSDVRAPGFIALREGDEIQFGKGPEGKKLSNGPIPRLCNLQLAVARALKMSGAADTILEWKYHADDGGCYHLFIASEEYFDMLDAKLLLSGRAMVVP